MYNLWFDGVVWVKRKKCTSCWWNKHTCSLKFYNSKMSYIDCNETEKIEIGKLRYCFCDQCHLGQGTYGTVFKGRFESKVDVAVKRVDKFLTRVEVDILRMVDGHANIVGFYCVEENSDFL